MTALSEEANWWEWIPRREIDELEEDNAWLTNLLADLRTENTQLREQLDIARGELDVANARVSAGKMAP